MDVINFNCLDILLPQKKKKLKKKIFFNQLDYIDANLFDY